MIDRVALDVSRLDPRLRETLQNLFLGKTLAREQVPAALGAALRNPVVVEAGLNKLRPDALCALSVVVDAGGPVPRGKLLGELSRTLGAKGPAALEALAATGLVVAMPHDDRIGLMASFAEALAAFVPAVEPMPDLPPVESDPLRFDVAVTLAFLAGARPRVNRDGRINITDLRKLEKRLAATPRLARRFDLLVDGLVDAHLLRLGERVELAPEATSRHFAQPLTASWAELIARRVSTWPMQRFYALCAAAAGGWVAAASVRRVLRLRAHIHGNERDVDADLELFADALLLERTSSAPGGERYYRAPQLPGPETGKWVVQPSFEVLAPPDTPPHALALLGRFAQLEHADRFASFRLNEASVQATIDEGASADELLGLLSEHAAHALPQNVELTVRGWARASRRAFLCEGLAIQFEDAAQRSQAVAALSDERIATTELGDRVVVVSTWERSRVKAVLRKLPMRALERGTASDGEAERPAMGSFDEDRSVRVQAPHQAAPMQARLRERIAEGRSALGATAAAASPALIASPELKARLERAARTRERLLVHIGDGVERVVRVERLRQRGADTYVEVVTTDGDHGFSIPIEELGVPQPIEVCGPIVTGEKTGRNDPCPCGSGRKYKRCCLSGPTPVTA